LNGTFNYNTGCITTPCPIYNATGACCNDGNCLDSITPRACNVSSGTFFPGTCSSTKCPPPVSGGCCLGHKCYDNYNNSACTGFFNPNRICSNINCPTDSSSSFESDTTKGACCVGNICASHFTIDDCNGKFFVQQVCSTVNCSARPFPNCRTYTGQSPANASNNSYCCDTGNNCPTNAICDTKRQICSCNSGWIAPECILPDNIQSNSNSNRKSSSPSYGPSNLTKWGIAMGAAALFLLVGTLFFVLRKRQIAKFNDEFYQPMIEIKDKYKDQDE